MDQIVIKPIITEKSMDETAHSRFTFKVARDANKPMIKKAIEEQFKVNVLDLQTMTVHGKSKRRGRTRRESHAQPWKKAIVRLKEGQKIDLFEKASA